MIYISALFIALLSITSCNNKAIEQQPKDETENVKALRNNLQSESKAVFASGCFWCVEAVFESVQGVKEVISGYAGGDADDANYSDVSAGITDHAEAVEVYYNPSVVDYKTLLKVFFGSQDPTTLNQQGPDRGRQYRSAIFYQNKEEKAMAEAYIAQLEKDKVFDGKITTTLEPLTKFYPAEDYHQDYEERNPNQPYVRSVSIPRLNKFKSKYPELLKEKK